MLDGLYERQANLKAAKVVEGQPLQDRHYLLKESNLLYYFYYAVYPKCYARPINEILFLSH